MYRNMIIGLTVATTSIFTLPAFAAPDYTTTLNRVEQEIVQPGYQHFATQAGALQKAVEAFCESDKAPADIRPAFHKTMDAWQAVQHIRQGPIAENNRHARVQFWPDKRAKTGKHLRAFLATGSRNDLATDVFGSKSVALQGLQALERLIFSKDGLPRTPTGDNNLASCSVATAITANLHLIGEEVVEAYTTAPPAPDAGMAVRAHVTDVITGLEVVSRLKLSGPIGEDRARPKLAENWRSERSLRNIQLNLVALRTQYIALVGDSLADDPQNNLVINQFDDAIGSVSGMADSFDQVLAGDNGRVKLRAVVFTLKDLKELAVMTLTSHLDINLGFNSLDGD